jgi:hypothetical protein
MLDRHSSWIFVIAAMDPFPSLLHIHIFVAIIPLELNNRIIVVCLGTLESRSTSIAEILRPNVELMIELISLWSPPSPSPSPSPSLIVRLLAGERFIVSMRGVVTEKPKRPFLSIYERWRVPRAPNCIF